MCVNAGDCSLPLDGCMETWMLLENACPPSHSCLLSMQYIRQKDKAMFDALVSLPCTLQKVHYRRANPVHMVYRRPHIAVDDCGEIKYAFQGCRSPTFTAHTRAYSHTHTSVHSLQTHVYCL